MRGMVKRYPHTGRPKTAYSLLADDAREQLHLRVGRLLRQNLDTGALDRRVFEIAGHLNLARSAIDDPDERIALATLNLCAGLRARESPSGAEGRDHAHPVGDVGSAVDAHAQAAAVEMGLGLGLVAPVVAGHVHRDREGARHLDEHRAVRAAMLEQEHAVAAVLAQPMGEHATGRAGADDDVVVHGRTSRAARRGPHPKRIQQAVPARPGPRGQ